MKRFSLALLTASLLLAAVLLAACGDTPEDTAAPATTASVTSTSITTAPVTTAPVTSTSTTTAATTTASTQSPEVAPYTVMYYLENVTGDGYTRMDDATEHLEGVAGTLAAAEEKVFPHFTLDRTRSVLEGDINGDGSLALKVYYTRESYTVSAEATDHGTAMGGGSYRYGTGITLTATPAPGYELLGWYEGETRLSAELTYTLSVEGARSITAKFFFNKAAFAPFTYTMDPTSCVITGLKDPAATAVVIPSGVTRIEDYAFRDRIWLTTVTFAKDSQCTSIGEGAFYGCEGLLSITIPKSVESIGESLFPYCSKPTVYCEARSAPEGWHYRWNDAVRPVVWNCRYNEIADDGYLYTEIDGLRYGLKSGNAKVVGQPSTIQTATIPEKVSYGGVVYSVTSIGYGAFQCCTELTSVTIPASVESIARGAFGNCLSLASLTIPATVTTIGEGAFSYCPELTLYCEAAEKPSGWHSAFKDSSLSVVWGHKADP